LCQEYFGSTSLSVDLIQVTEIKATTHPFAYSEREYLREKAFVYAFEAHDIDKVPQIRVVGFLGLLISSFREGKTW